MRWSSASAFIVNEFKEVLPPTVFFIVGFNLILLTVNLALNDYDVRFGTYLLATTGALVVGKAVLVANKLPFLRRLDGAPLIQPILYKTAIYFTVVLVFRFLERVLGYLLDGGSFGGIPDYVAEHFLWNRFLAIQIWILVLFLIYGFVSELNELFGDGETAKLLFTRRSSEVKMTRRQRLRALVKLSELTDAHTTAELVDVRTVAHARLVGLLRGLARPQGRV